MVYDNPQYALAHGGVCGSHDPQLWYAEALLCKHPRLPLASLARPQPFFHSKSKHVARIRCPCTPCLPFMVLSVFFAHTNSHECPNMCRSQLLTQLGTLTLTVSEVLQETVGWKSCGAKGLCKPFLWHQGGVGLWNPTKCWRLGGCGLNYQFRKGVHKKVGQ